MDSCTIIHDTNTPIRPTRTLPYSPRRYIFWRCLTADSAAASFPMASARSPIRATSWAHDSRSDKRLIFCRIHRSHAINVVIEDDSGMNVSMYTSKITRLVLCATLGSDIGVAACIVLLISKRFTRLTAWSCPSSKSLEAVCCCRRPAASADASSASSSSEESSVPLLVLSGRDEDDRGTATEPGTVPGGS